MIFKVGILFKIYLLFYYNFVNYKIFSLKLAMQQHYVNKILYNISMVLYIANCEKM